MAAEPHLPITQPLLHVLVVTLARVRLAMMLLSSLPLLLAVLPLLDIGGYTIKFLGNWCFLPVPGNPVHGRHRAVWPWNFSGLGLPGEGLSLHCDILSGLLLLQAWLTYKGVKEK